MAENNRTPLTKHSHSVTKIKSGAGKRKKESKKNDAQEKIDNGKEQ